MTSSTEERTGWLRDVPPLVPGIQLGGGQPPVDPLAPIATPPICGHPAPGDRRRCRQLPPIGEHGTAAGGVVVHTDGEVFWTRHRDFLYADAGLTSLADEAELHDRVEAVTEELEKLRPQVGEIEEAKVDPDPFPGYESVGVRRDADFPAHGLQDTGRRETALGGAGALRERAPGKGRFDLLSPFVLRRLAEHMEAGALKYTTPEIDGARNWEKGQPFSWVLDSANRHLADYLAGDRSEDHLAAALWNLHALAHFEHLIGLGILPAELDDLPHYLDQKGLPDA